ncbi:hypothetical protein WME75_33320 [Sorangium sp. So ce1014]|uniref:hypothetical protein n=1 Tax=Sorangium sp. So ce1014 TaxID=3133326 RepID=UPI003F63608B
MVHTERFRFFAPWRWVMDPFLREFHPNEGGAGATAEAVVGSYGWPPPRSS